MLHHDRFFLGAKNMEKMLPYFDRMQAGVDNEDDVSPRRSLTQPGALGLCS